MGSNLITQLFTQINKAIDYKISGLTQVKSATVHSVNQDQTINLYIPPSSTVYHNIQNQSIYQKLQAGDNVKVIVENGNLSNMWIIGGFNLSANQQINHRIDFDLIYPIGSIYMSINDADPAVLFGGKWKKIEDKFLLSSGKLHSLNSTGGSEHEQLTVSQLPKISGSFAVPVINSHGTYGIDGYATATNFGSIGADIPYGVTGTNVSTGTQYGYGFNFGSNEPHNNMPPYLTVNMWQRIQ